MKVVFSTYECPGLSGNFRRAIQMVKGLQANGCEVVLITGATKWRVFPTQYDHDGITIIESPGLLSFKYRFAGFDPWDITVRFFIAFSQHADAYHSFNPKPSSVLSLWLVAKLQRKPWLFDWADLWGDGGIKELKKKYTSLFTRISSFVESWLEKWCLTHADLTTCISRSMVAHCTKAGGNALYLPVAAAPDVQFLSQAVARKNLGISLKAKVVGFMFTDSPDSETTKTIIKKLEKDHILFIAMGPRLFTEKAPKNLIYNTFTERQSVSQLLAACDICLMPFANKKINRYRYPNKIADYIAAGKPCIANPTGDIKTLIEKENIGWLVPEKPSEFAMAIRKILKNNIDIQKKAKLTHQFAKKTTWKVLTKQLKSHYRTLSVSK